MLGMSWWVRLTTEVAALLDGYTPNCPSQQH